MLLLIAGLVITGVGGILGGDGIDEGKNTSSPQAVSMSAPVKTSQVLPNTPQQPSVAEKAASAMPIEQRNLIAAVEKARTAYKAGKNDMQKGATRPTRAKDICSALTSKNAVQWVGQIAELSSNNEGRGVVSIQIAKDVHVKTWNNALSDVVDRTLIDPDSNLFRKASNLNKNQWVVFSGTFPSSETDCIHESSITIEGSVLDPEFILRFSDINPINTQ